MAIRMSNSDRYLKSVSYLVVGLFALLCLFPLVVALGVSFSDERLVVIKGYKIIPAKFSVETYGYIFRTAETWLLKSYFVSVAVTLVGTFSSVLVTSLLAYGLANKQVAYRNAISFFCYFTMLFGGGLVPWYIVCVNFYHLNDTFLALFAPYLVSVFFLLILRTFFSGIPDSLMESARMDGASDFRIYAQIVVPVSQTALITIALFYGLQYWNDWFLPLMFASNPDLYSLQYRLYTILSNTQSLSSAMAGSLSSIRVPSETIKMATTVLTVVPILLVYPFVQRYFVRGLTVGAVKG